jgi:hypothetical protein
MDGYTSIGHTTQKSNQSGFDSLYDMTINPNDENGENVFFLSAPINNMLAMKDSFKSNEFFKLKTSKKDFCIDPASELPDYILAIYLHDGTNFISNAFGLPIYKDDNLSKLKKIRFTKKPISEKEKKDIGPNNFTTYLEVWKSNKIDSLITGSGSAPGFVPASNPAPGFVPASNPAPGFVPASNPAPGQPYTNNLSKMENVVAPDLTNIYNSNPSAASDKYILKTQIVPPVFPKCTACCNSTGPCGVCNGSSCLSPGSAPGLAPGSAPGSRSVSNPGSNLISPAGFGQNLFNSTGSVYNNTLGTTTNTLNSGIGTLNSVFTPGIGTVGNTIKSGINTTGNTLTTGLNSTTNALGSGVNSAGNTIGSGVNSVGNTAQNVGNSAGNLITSAGSGTKNTLTSIGSSASDFLKTAGSDVKDLIISGARGITKYISNVNFSAQGPAPENNKYFQTPTSFPSPSSPQKKYDSSSKMLSNTNSPSPFERQFNTPVNSSPAALFTKNESSTKIKAQVYPISDYYTNLFNVSSGTIPLKEEKKSANFSPSPAVLSIGSPSIFSTSPQSNVSPSDIKLCMTPGAREKNINDNWIKVSNAPSADYEPLPSDLGPFQKFD